MGKRSATLRLEGLAEFLAVWTEQLSQGNVFLPEESLDGELAGEFKLDLMLPLVGRVGPIEAQVIQRSPDGIAAQIQGMPAEVRAAAQGVLDFLEEAKALLVKNGELVEPGAAVASAAAGPTIVVQQVSGKARPGDGFTLPDIGDREADASGDLKGRGLRDYMVQLAVRRATGLLTVVKGNGTRKFGFWQKGGPVGWRSEPVDKDEVLGVILLKAGHINEDQLARSLEVMETMVCRQGEAFIEMGVLTFAQLVMVLQKQTEFVLQRVMRDREGVWAFHTLEELPEAFITPPVRVPSVLYQALREHARELPAGSLQALQKKNLDRYVHLDPASEPVINDIGWTKDERKFLEVLQENSWRLRELFSVSPLSRQMTSCVVWALNDLGFLGYGETEDLGRYLERVGTRILTKAQRSKSANHFDILEVHWICLKQEVEGAYKRLKDEFQSDQFHDLTPEMETALKVIDKYVEEAYAAVVEDLPRRAYRLEVVEEDTIKQSAELLGRKGEMAIMKHDRKEASMCWGRALELVPNSAAFREGYQRALAT
jgi:hypothetical protein